ncbi:patatin-like protein [Niveispirillum sp. KHB5.9]|uniref:patatin-like protein n=1 Tax=Niveispirillum sp. KHB5.9 TaxID=3400269 RepID=UPI003A8456C2
MKEKELRVALVCYGGVSLAVYMHGVTKELWKLVRASQALHAGRNGQSTSFKAALAGDPRPFDTESVYFELLRDLLPDLSLRVLIDVVAGASAGGINGVLLARALAHDLDLEPLTVLWLENADVTRLLTNDSRAGKWSKWFMRPVLWAMTRRLQRLAPDEEVREKLSLFVRSRWFRPPFDGNRLMGFLLDAAHAMGDSARRPLASLLPRGLPLSLHVTVTDFHGYTTRIPAHDPPEILEREHRHRFTFLYRRGGEGEVDSDFKDGDVPGLIFAARASASYPGAFPPAQVRQMDRLLNERGEGWEGRGHFFQRNFAEYRRQGADPEQASFIDGSVLNNKPFAAALSAIAGRPAYREVDRRIVYIDPKPARLTGGVRPETPGFFRTIRGALSDIPRNEPVRDELLAIAGRNARIERLRGLLDAARPRVAEQVLRVLDGPLPPAPTIEQIRHWRDRASAEAASQAGFAYEAYLRLKIEGALEQLAGLLCPCLGRTDAGARASLLKALNGWARARGVLPDRLEEGRAGERPTWVRFLRDFDIAFRARRLRFLIRELNAIYPLVGEGEHADTRARDLDEMKASLYSALERLPGGTGLTDDGLGMFNAGERSALGNLMRADGPVPSPDTLDRALAQLAGAWKLEAQSAEIDEIFALMGLNYLGPAARRQIFEAYLGFSFWDVLTFSTSGWVELDEFHAIRVDRIAPPDARLLRRAGAPADLRSARMNAFGGFFSRHDREHDYLLGRLHAAERVIDLVIDAGGMDMSDARANGVKLRAFHAILVAEEKRLGAGNKALEQVRAWVEACG